MHLIKRIRPKWKIRKYRVIEHRGQINFALNDDKSRNFILKMRIKYSNIGKGIQNVKQTMFKFKSLISNLFF